MFIKILPPFVFLFCGSVANLKLGCYYAAFTDLPPLLRSKGNLLAIRGQSTFASLRHPRPGRGFQIIIFPPSNIQHRLLRIFKHAFFQLGGKAFLVAGIAEFVGFSSGKDTRLFPGVYGTDESIPVFGSLCEAEIFFSRLP